MRATEPMFVVLDKSNTARVTMSDRQGIARTVEVDTLATTRAVGMTILAFARRNHMEAHDVQYSVRWPDEGVRA